jgi:hypothetical protein
VKIWSGDIAPEFFTSALHADEKLASRFIRSTPWGKGLKNPLCRRLHGAHGRSGRYGEEEITCLCWESNLGLSVCRLSYRSSYIRELPGSDLDRSNNMIYVFAPKLECRDSDFK